MAAKGGRQRPAIAFGDACAQLEAALGARRAILEQVATLAPLRAAMRAHSFPVLSGSVDLKRLVQAFDSRSRAEGLHVVQGWDFNAHRFTDDITPVLLLDYCARLELSPEALSSARAALLDQYFLTVLSLLSVRAWDEGDANTNLDRLGALLDVLHGPGASGHRAIEDIETLLFLAVSYYHPDERCYGMLLDKVRTLDDAHRLRIAVPCAAMLSGHLRWGLHFMYERDVGRMRDDNVVDYPWLLFAIAELARSHRDAKAGEALLAGLAADPWAFSGTRPPLLDAQQEMHAHIVEWLGRDGAEFLEGAAKRQPAASEFAPLGFTCNFPTNAAVALVAVSLEDGRAYPSLNMLFARDQEGAGGQSAALARRLADYSVADPARLGARGAPLIVYDPRDGVHAFNNVVRVLRG